MEKARDCLTADQQGADSGTDIRVGRMIDLYNLGCLVIFVDLGLAFSIEPEGSHFCRTLTSEKPRAIMSTKHTRKKQLIKRRKSGCSTISPAFYA